MRAIKLPSTSAEDAMECNTMTSRAKERGIERQAAMAACAAPTREVKESHPKFNIILEAEMKSVALAVGKMGHGLSR